MPVRKNAQSPAQQYEIVTSPEGFLSFALDVLNTFRQMAQKSGYGTLESAFDDAIREVELQKIYVVQNRPLH